MTEVDLTIAKRHLYRLLGAREFPKTICPSEAARALSTAELHESGVDDWRELMVALRKLAFELRDQGEIEVLQRGAVLPRHQAVADTRGPIRLRKVEQQDSDCD